MSQYQKGQKVQILPDLTAGRGIYGDTYCNGSMVKSWAGKIVTLELQSDRTKTWSINEDNWTWDWNELMFRPVGIINSDEAFKMYLREDMSEEEYEMIRRERG